MPTPERPDVRAPAPWHSALLLALWQAAWRHRGRTLAALALLLAAKGAAVAVPLLLKLVIDGHAQPVPAAAADLAFPALAGLMVGYALLRFASTLFTELRDLVFAKVSLQAVADHAERVYAHLLQLHAGFHAQRQTGVLIREVDRGTAGIGFLVGTGLFTLLPTVIEFGAVLVVIGLAYSPWFSAIIVLTFFVYAGYTLRFTQRRAVRQRQVNRLDAQAHGRLVDTLINHETVKTHARERQERARYADVLARWVDRSRANQRALSLLHVGQGAIIALAVAGVMLLAGWQTLHGRMSVGDLVLVNAYVIQVCLPLNALGFVFREARDAWVDVEQLYALLGTRPEIEDHPAASGPVGGAGDAAVAFEQVDFGYDAGRKVLSGIDLRIEPGQTVAVVGGSGSGKSTLARLLLRQYDPTAGRVTVWGQDLRALRQDQLRERIGLVPQDTVLFNDTIAYNIAYGRDGAGLAEVVEAARAAQLHEFIVSLPQQYDTPVGERGLQLSGGERQRIAIARALLKDPPILVFDEATSALDTRAERAIQRELDRAARGRTTLVIAHRLSTVVAADEIVVMDRGRIVERGRHEALLAHGGLYAQMCQLQQQQQQLDRLERQLALQPVNLAALLAGVLEALRDTWEARGVRLFADVDAEHGGVTGDPSVLTQVLHDLLRRAALTTPPGGHAAVTLRRQGHLARLTITDTASLPGLATGTAPQDGPVSTAPADNAPPIDPLALRTLIERQGGCLQVEPPSATQGLAWVIDLPLRAVALPRALAMAPPDAPRLAGPGAPVTQAAAVHGVRVLCIDDQLDARLSLQQLLQSHGVQVSSYASGREALLWLEGQPSAGWPQLLVCDIVLGDEDGHAVVRRLRRLEDQRGIPLAERLPAIALTGLAGAEHRMRSMLAGFQLHLTKPVDPDELLHGVAMLARRPPPSGPPHPAAGADPADPTA